MAYFYLEVLENDSSAAFGAGSSVERVSAEIGE